MSLSALGTIAVVLIATWTLGGLALRLAGSLVFWVGLLGLVVTGDANGLLVAFLGALAWLAGQGHHALRHGATKSPLAGLIFAGAASLWRRWWQPPHVRRQERKEGP
jgi:hypothetical protein